MVRTHPKYKYRLTLAHKHYLRNFEPGAGKIRLTVGLHTWATLDLDSGELWIARNYHWDGASGPAMDTVTMHRGSMIHDVIYQMIAHGVLPKKPWKLHADREFQRVIAQDGCSWIRQSYAYRVVRVFGRGRDKYEPPTCAPTA